MECSFTNSLFFWEKFCHIFYPKKKDRHISTLDFSKGAGGWDFFLQVLYFLKETANHFCAKSLLGCSKEKQQFQVFQFCDLAQVVTIHKYI